MISFLGFSGIFLNRKANTRDHFIITLITDVTDATLGASDLLLGTRTGAGGTATLA